MHERFLKQLQIIPTPTIRLGGSPIIRFAAAVPAVNDVLSQKFDL